MSDRPILFSAPMVRALLDGRKTQTRRELKLPDAPENLGRWEASTIGGAGVTDGKGRPVEERPCVWHTRIGAVVAPRFAVGDRLWVRETWRTNYGLDYFDHKLGRCPKPTDMDPETTAIEYLADGERQLGGVTRVAIHMPRWASRLTLLVSDVRVERLQDCSPNDVRAEGVEIPEARQMMMFGMTADERADYRKRLADMAFSDLWNNINGAGAWEANPWVVAVTFTVEQRNIDRG